MGLGTVSAATFLQRRSIQELNSLAVRGLGSMFDPETKLFCRRFRHTERGLIREGVSHRYTIMALLGLLALKGSGSPCPVDTDAAFRSCVSDLRWARGIGDVGLLIWFTAQYAPNQLDDLFRRMELETCLDRFPDAREARTMELAWFLTGLCFATMADTRCKWPLEDLAVQTYLRLEQNRGESGLFGHLSRSKSWAGLIRGRVGTFADQMYSVFALSKFATTFSLEEPLGSALECALRLCALQGNLGQWWRFYDAVAGTVLVRYPLYSVDQYGTAPMVLSMLERATGQRFQNAIHRGVDWICGANELGKDLRLSSQGIIWAGIAPTNRFKKYWDAAMGFCGTSNERACNDALEVLYESRPYELGLLLCSFAAFGTTENQELDLGREAAES